MHVPGGGGPDNEPIDYCAGVVKLGLEFRSLGCRTNGRDGPGVCLGNGQTEAMSTHASFYDTIRDNTC